MSSTLAKALIGLLPSCILLAASAVMFAKQRRWWSILQLVGAAGMVLVILVHVCEALQILPWLHWGQERSAGHYLDLIGGMVGITLFPLGYLLQAIAIGNRTTDG